VYYRELADIGYWDNLWKKGLSPRTYRLSERGHLDLYEEPITKYLPRQGRILEAGCGTGSFVLALRTRGYNVEGVDWAAETIRAVKSLWPDLRVQVGDVRRLGVKDSCYEGYISLGVVEHFQAGPEPIFQEARRVLVPKGIMLVAVPYFNPLRQFKSRLGLYRGHVANRGFYQYAFSTTEFTSIIQDCGFEIIEVYACNAAKGFKDEILPVRALAEIHKKVNNGVLLLLNLVLEWQRWARHHFGHMLMVVARSLKA
jgi:SAM-dependent methyltransferase